MSDRLPNPSDDSPKLDDSGKTSVEKLKSPPPTPVPLDYGQRVYGESISTSTGQQVWRGFLLWLLALGIFYLLSQNHLFAGNLQLLAGVEVTLVAGLSLWLRIKYRWRGFIPGVLLGFGLTCLVPIGILAVVCGNWKP